MSTKNADRERAGRAARNQALYREVNERVKAINEAFDSLLPLGSWICECAREECVERLSLAYEEYEQVRSAGTHFVVYPGEEHVLPDVERVVARYERYWVVEKIGIAAELAQKVDPRARA